MPLAYQDVPARLRQRICLVCGYDGPELQPEAGDEAYRCPACDADLYARPARSYAELEGLAPFGERTRSSSSEEGRLSEIKARRAWPLWVGRLLSWLRGSRRRDPSRV